jgi:hypothetical protein
MCFFCLASWHQLCLPSTHPTLFTQFFSRDLSLSFIVPKIYINTQLLVRSGTSRLCEMSFFNREDGFFDLTFRGAPFLTAYAYACTKQDYELLGRNRRPFPKRNLTTCPHDPPAQVEFRGLRRASLDENPR